MPLAVKGVVKKASARVAITSFLLGDKATPYEITYGNARNFDLTKQILPTNYTSQGKSVLGVNLVLTTTGGELVLTDFKFAVQQK
ncbi:hypothetical protein [Nostoc sp. GT001]|uniref:hypothetical protein n=1 Tax=Nostoc sp. GT001 TaxID=3056647 RepID=UPI0025AB39BF|nr:hypothetical protein [Nostoc sp. GT001]MDM9581800.1 hypothetical protein [Nostoc sp. GT001]